MNERVKEFLEKKQVSREAIKQKNRNEFLISVGLCDKIYSPKGNKTKEYCYEEFDANSAHYRYYSLIPINVTDEEFEQVKEAVEEETKEKSVLKSAKKVRTNGISIALKVIAIVVYSLAFFVGCIAGGEQFWISLACWVGGCISGTLFLGFSEIIELLTDIKSNK